MNKFENFLTEKGINKEQFTAKSAEEMAGLYNEYNEKNATLLTELVEKGQEDNAEVIKSLKKEITESKMERDILKKAVSSFSKSDR